MKRTLASILAALMLLGVFAIGADAARQTEATEAAETAAARDDETAVPELPFAPSGLSQQIMNWLLYLPNLIAPDWADGVIDYLVPASWAVPPPFNWLIIWFVRAL